MLASTTKAVINFAGLTERLEAVPFQNKRESGLFSAHL